uniref:Uncharacterized protein n=1 Tax=Lactuca sativa TaxID=4236 RepID=A0A9R1W6V7_LACSA|nr:hypothetical protein LSAT_V11C300152340 [Lactuca sativa]
MASSPNPTDQNVIVVDFHYNGQFAPKPLVYFDSDSASCKMLTSVHLVHGIPSQAHQNDKQRHLFLPSTRVFSHTPVNEGDYKEFLDLVYANEKRMNVYVDHHNEPIFDWIKAEESESENEDLDEDEDLVIKYSYTVDHEEDDATYPYPTNKTAHDRFLNILFEPTKSEDQDDEYMPP